MSNRNRTTPETAGKTEQFRCDACSRLIPAEEDYSLGFQVQIAKQQVWLTIFCENPDDRCARLQQALFRDLTPAEAAWHRELPVAGAHRVPLPRASR